MEELKVGTIQKGTVRSIAKYGAFVDLSGGSRGLVHISEISDSYVADVSSFLIVGQEVTVKVISLESGKVGLSIKQAERTAAAPEKRAPERQAERRAPEKRRKDERGRFKPAPPKPEPATFEEKLKQFMSDSDRKLSGCRHYEHITRSRKR